jgi:predicted nucleic acid-binding protein
MRLADPPKRVYWDACAWIGFINEEPEKILPLRHIWEAAQRAEYEIWTSVYSYLEVLKIKAPSGDPISVAESNRRVDDMFQQAHVKRVALDTEIARFARQVKQTHHDAGLKSRPDAIHVATAAYYNLDEFHTWDNAHILPFDHKIERRDGKTLHILIPGPEVLGPLFALLAPKPKKPTMPKTKGNRTTEREMRIGALQVAASKANGRATTTQLKDEIHKYVDLTREDQVVSVTRPNEPIYHQIIGNIISHQSSATNIFSRGLATYTGDGIQITDAGRDYLRRNGL